MHPQHTECAHAREDQRQTRWQRDWCCAAAAAAIEITLVTRPVVDRCVRQIFGRGPRARKSINKEGPPSVASFQVHHHVQVRSQSIDAPIARLIAIGGPGTREQYATIAGGGIIIFVGEYPAIETKHFESRASRASVWEYGVRVIPRKTLRHQRVRQRQICVITPVPVEHDIVAAEAPPTPTPTANSAAPPAMIMRFDKFIFQSLPSQIAISSRPVLLFTKVTPHSHPKATPTLFTCGTPTINTFAPQFGQFYHRK